VRWDAKSLRKKPKKAKKSLKKLKKDKKSTGFDLKKHKNDDF